MTKVDENGLSARLSHLEIGEWGEKLSQTGLIRRGWKVLWTNFRPKGGGEIDLVCRDSDVLVFVEVKTRTSLDYGRPSEAVDHEKRKLILRGASSWLRQLNKPEVRHRFDIMEVILEEGLPPKLNLIENAFSMSEF